MSCHCETEDLRRELAQLRAENRRFSMLLGDLNAELHTTKRKEHGLRGALTRAEAEIERMNVALRKIADVAETLNP